MINPFALLGLPLGRFESMDGDKPPGLFAKAKCYDDWFVPDEPFGWKSGDFLVYRCFKHLLEHLRQWHFFSCF
jgi:hypothetical protein